MSAPEPILIDKSVDLERWTEYEARLVRAANGLRELADRREDPWDHERLLGKVDGILLALAYLREYGLPS
jgi:hypothetical protein